MQESTHIPIQTSVSIDLKKSLAPRDLGQLLFYNVLYLIGIIWWQWTWIELVLFMALEGFLGLLEFYLQLFLRMMTAPFYGEGTIVSKFMKLFLMLMVGVFALLFFLTGGWFLTIIPFFIPFVCFGLHVPEGGGKIQDFLLAQGVTPGVLKEQLLYVVVSGLVFIAVRSIVFLHKNNKVPTLRFLVAPIIRSWAISLTITPAIIIAAYVSSPTVVIVVFLLFKFISDVLLHYLAQVGVKLSLESKG